MLDLLQVLSIRGWTKWFSSKQHVTVFYHWWVCSPAVPSLLAEIPLRQKLIYIETKSARRRTGLTYYTWALELVKHLPGSVHIILRTKYAGMVTCQQPVYWWPKDSATVMWYKCLLAKWFLTKWCVTVFYPWRVCSPAVPSLPAEIPLRQTDIQKLDLPEGVLTLLILHWVWS